MWIEHIDHTEPVMMDLLMRDRVCIHPHIIGESSLGSQRDRTLILRSLGDLPRVPVAMPDEVFYLVEQEKLFNRANGYIDASLLTASRLQPGVTVWTRDRRLRNIAEELALAAVLER